MSQVTWFNGKTVESTTYCDEFLKNHKIIYSEGSFYTPSGRLTDISSLRKIIYNEIKEFSKTNPTKTVSNIIETLKLAAEHSDIHTDYTKIHMSNGTLDVLTGEFTEQKNEIVRNRLPINYNPDAEIPHNFLKYIGELFYGEDIPAFQEFMGYCFLPSTKAQKMLIIKGNGGEGKSQLGVVLKAMFGDCMKDGSITKLSESRFAKADLESILLMLDDDMDMNALSKTDTIKKIITAEGKIDMERKGEQSFQGWTNARFIGLSNGDLQALYDKSDGFYRRQLIITTKPKKANRVDDPFIAEKMKEEAEGIFEWFIDGAKRLIENNFRFSESERSRMNRENAARSGNNVIEFMESKGYIRSDLESEASTKELFAVYRIWCEDNGEADVKLRTFSKFLQDNEEKYGLKYSKNIKTSNGRYVRGFKGITTMIETYS